MRRAALGVVLAMAAGLTGPVARAGIYSTAEPVFPLNEKDVRQFQETSWIPLRQIGTKEGRGDQRRMSKSYEMAAALAELALKAIPPGGPDPLTVEQRLNVGAYLLRMRKPEDAIRVLTPVTRVDRDNFLVMATLGTANQMAGDHQPASDWLTEAGVYFRRPFKDLEAKFPGKVMGWKEADFAHYRRMEEYHSRLVRLRLREVGSKKVNFSTALTQALERLDPLFDPTLKFVGESGQFGPGKVAAVERKKLPPDAILIVEQLLVWLPDDLRLNWLLGELYNAEGDIVSARMLMDNLVKRYGQGPEFPGFGDPKPEGMTPEQEQTYIKQQQEFLEKVVYPRFLEKFPAAGQHLKALKEYVAPPLADLTPAEAKRPSPPAPPTKTPPTEGPVIGVAVDWQTLAVGFGAGALVVLFATWQMREVRRRWSARRPAAGDGALAHPPGAAGIQGGQR